MPEPIKSPDEETVANKPDFRAFLLRLLPLFVLAHLGHHLLWALIVPLLPFIRNDLTLDYTQSGWLVSAFTVSYGISQLPAGWLTARIGSRTAITIGIAGVALSGLLIGLSPSYLVMVIFVILLGITGGPYHPAAITLISESVTPEKRGRALGIHQIGGAASHFLAPLIALAIAGALGWRGSFIATAIPVIAFGIAFFILLGRWGYVRETRRETPDGDTEAIRPQRRQSDHLIAFLVLSIVGQSLIVATISFIPLFLVDHFGVSEEIAAALLALTYSGGFWAAPLGGYLSDRIGTVPVIVVVTLLTGPVIYLLNILPYGLGIGVLLVLVGVALDSRMPVSEAYITSHTSERNRSKILGIYYFGSRGGPGLITPLLGYIIDRAGFYPSFTLVGAAMVLVTVICSVFLWNKRER